jgi:hypothetical protein
VGDDGSRCPRAAMPFLHGRGQVAGPRKREGPPRRWWIGAGSFVAGLDPTAEDLGGQGWLSGSPRRRFTHAALLAATKGGAGAGSVWQPGPFP